MCKLLSSDLQRKSQMPLAFCHLNMYCAFSLIKKMSQPYKWSNYHLTPLRFSTFFFFFFLMKSVINLKAESDSIFIQNFEEFCNISFSFYQPLKNIFSGVKLIIRYLNHFPNFVISNLQMLLILRFQFHSTDPIFDQLVAQIRTRITHIVTIQCRRRD